VSALKQFLGRLFKTPELVDEPCCKRNAGVVFNRRTRERSAQATGTITALGMNFAFSPSVFADISKTSSGSVTITH
jgi:hypothetical protein